MCVYACLYVFVCIYTYRLCRVCVCVCVLCVCGLCVWVCIESAAASYHISSGLILLYITMCPHTALSLVCSVYVFPPLLRCVCVESARGGALSLFLFLSVADVAIGERETDRVCESFPYKIIKKIYTCVCVCVCVRACER